jgi:hypothetical protein
LTLKESTQGVRNTFFYFNPEQQQQQQQQQQTSTFTALSLLFHFFSFSVYCFVLLALFSQVFSGFLLQEMETRGERQESEGTQVVDSRE